VLQHEKLEEAVNIEIGQPKERSLAEGGMLREEIEELARREVRKATCLKDVSLLDGYNILNITRSVLEDVP